MHDARSLDADRLPLVIHYSTAMRWWIAMNIENIPESENALIEFSYE